MARSNLVAACVLAGLLGGLAGPGQAQDITSNLVVWYRLDETALTTASDSSLNALHATLINTPAWTAGCQVNGCLTFVAASSQRVQLPGSSLLDIAGDLTLATWLKTSAVNGMLIGGYQTGPPFTGYGWRLNNNVPELWTGSAWTAASASVNDNAWHHVAVTVAGTTATFYKDGLTSGTGTVAVPGAYTGQKELASVVGGSGYLSGLLDEFRIYARALTQADIQALMVATPPGRVRRRPLLLE